MGSSEFLSEIDAAFQKAWHSEKGGDGNWNNFMQGYKAVPLSPSEKEMLLNSEIKIVKGAFPVELRRVFEKILENAQSSGDSAKINDAKNFDLDSKIREYYMKIKPFSGMGDIFGNAAATSGKYSTGMKSAKHHTMKCKNCGSPRLEEMQYDNCLFCGSKLFEPA